MILESIRKSGTLLCMNYTCCFWHSILKCFGSESMQMIMKIKIDWTIEYWWYNYCITDWNTPASIDLFRVSNGNTKLSCEICPELASKTLEQHCWRWSGIFFVDFEQVSHIIMVFPCWLWKCTFCLSYITFFVLLLLGTSITEETTC